MELLPGCPGAAMIFADPPDNIGLGYDEYRDRLTDGEYTAWLERCVWAFVHASPTVWISFNARWTVALGAVADRLCRQAGHQIEVKPCVQVYTFGQHRQNDLGNNHRPLWRFRRTEAPVHADHVRVASWRQRNGDKRADSRGRVPGDVFDMQYPVPGLGDVFDFPRVTGNSKQRCDWHPTQLHEELVARCVLLSSRPGELVIDPFAGTGTTGRVCRALGRKCLLLERSASYCRQIAASLGLAHCVEELAA